MTAHFGAAPLPNVRPSREPQTAGARAQRRSVLLVLGLLSSLWVSSASASPDGVGVAAPANPHEPAAPLDTGPAAEPVGWQGGAGELPEVGWEWGLKLGVELPVGDADGSGLSVLGERVRGTSLNGLALVNVPVALELGYRTSPRWWWGIEAAAGLGPAGDDCPNETQCTFSSIRLSAQGSYSLAPESSTDPWLSVLLGYESVTAVATRVLTLDDEQGEEQQVPLRAEESLGGPLLALQAGLQFELAPHLQLGPYLTAAAGAYLLDSFDCAEQLSCPDGGGVDEIRPHGWLGLGVRGTHGP